MFRLLAILTISANLSAFAADKVVTLKGLPSGKSAIGLRVGGCPAVSIEADGETLSRVKGIFTAQDSISGDATVTIRVPANCQNEVLVSEQKTDGLSQDEAKLPPEAPATPSEEKAAPATASSATNSEGAPLRSQAVRKGATISVPGRFLQNSRNSTVDTAVQSSGNVRRRDVVNNNIGTSVDLERRGGTVIRRNNIVESDNDTVRTRSSGSKGGQSQNDSTPAFAGHSHINSSNKLATSGITDFGNQDTETEIVGNVGGRVRIIDEVNNLVDERSELRATPQPKEVTHVHNHQTTVNPAPQITVVRQPTYVIGYYYDAYGRMWYGPHYRY